MMHSPRKCWVSAYIMQYQRNQIEIYNKICYRYHNAVYIFELTDKNIISVSFTKLLISKFSRIAVIKSIKVCESVKEILYKIFHIQNIERFTSIGQ